MLAALAALPLTTHSLCAADASPAVAHIKLSGDLDETPVVPDTAAGLWTPAFPSPEMVDAAAALLPAVHEQPGTLAEGPRWELTVGPGIFQVACRDWAKRERTEERARSARVKDVDASVAAFVATGEWPDPAPPRSAKERSRVRIQWMPAGSRPLAGSSRISSPGSPSSACAMPRRCRMPRE